VQAPALPEAGTAPPHQATAFNYAAHAMARAAAHEPTANPALASTGQPEPEGGKLLIAAARDSLPLRSVTQQRRGTKHQTPPRNRPPASQPASPEPNAPPKKTRGPGAISAALAAAAPAAAPPPPSPSPPPLPTEPLPFLVTNVEHDGVLWVWGRTEASGDAQSGTVGTWRRIPGVTFH